ncbi:ABC transporter permease [Chelatococcus reniformis]|uniref:Peptide ABC transporter permease n=1 Tax=Chelatococcus reniformis TaxID=1494448 RepID=A0A916US18_9HYPH|nr:ABC transporter permease [Chelatococcus reniformis]GGC85079.1 peptide ABC transporter permease [Chelatococcus reniformis]
MSLAETDVPLVVTETPSNRKGVSVSRRIWRAAFASYEFRVGLVVFAVLVAAALLYPSLSGIDPTKMNVAGRLQAPWFLGDKWSWSAPLGTDQIGRDMLVRSLVGLRYSLLIGFSTVVLMLAVGCTIGMLAGYYGGKVDLVLMRITDAQLSIPMIILAITVLGVSRPTIPAIILVLGLSSWPVYARVTRSVVMTERKQEYVRAALVSGASDLRIMALLLAPLILPPIVFISVLDVARMMIFESILGFMGLGVQPPTPTFGSIIADGRKYLLNAWWIATMPGIFLCLTLTSVNLMGASLERARNRIYGGA